MGMPVRDVTISSMKERDVTAVARLQMEFDEYLRPLYRRSPMSLGLEERTARLRTDGFGDDPAFWGLLARREQEVVGYLLYHFGYDPDEMRGRVVYVIDLFVTASARRAGIGSLLMRAAADLCGEKGGSEVYVQVWKRNRTAWRFYRKLGAKPLSETPFLRWRSERWPSGQDPAAAGYSTTPEYRS